MGNYFAVCTCRCEVVGVNGPLAVGGSPNIKTPQVSGLGCLVGESVEGFRSHIHGYYGTRLLGVSNALVCNLHVWVRGGWDELAPCSWVQSQYHTPQGSGLGCLLGESVEGFR